MRVNFMVLAGFTLVAGACLCQARPAQSGRRPRSQSASRQGAVLADPNLSDDFTQNVADPNKANYEPQVLVRFGDQVLTRTHVQWLVPGASEQTVKEVARIWLEDQILYAEAVKRRLTETYRWKYLAELERRRSYANQLRKLVVDSVAVPEPQVEDYYEKNKTSDLRLIRPASATFIHIRVNNGDAAAKIIERLNEGEEAQAIAKECSVYVDAPSGGAVSAMPAHVIGRVYGDSMRKALLSANDGAVVGPIEVDEGIYEVVKVIKIEQAQPRHFEKIRPSIKSILETPLKRRAQNELVSSLCREQADKIYIEPSLKEDVLKRKVLTD